MGFDPDGTSTKSPQRQLAHAPIWLLALITFSGTLALHIFVPALPIVTADLDTSPGLAQLTLSFYIAGLALGQLVYGPISDRFGRRPVLAVGMIVYALASLASLFAPTIQVLIIARLFQALGGCSGLVLGRAIARDNASDNLVAKNLSLMNLMVVIGPGLSPLVGSVLVETAGWRSIFVALFGLGLLNLLLIWRLLPESRDSGSSDIRIVLRNYAGLLKSPRFWGLMVGGGCATTSFYAFIGASPFIFVDQLHRPMNEIGNYLALNIAGVWFGSLTASRMIGRVAAGRLMVIGNLLSCTGAAIFLLAAISGSLDLLLAVLPMLLLTFGAGIASPTALSEALNVNPRAAGSASGLYGCAQMSIGAVCASMASVGGNPALSAGTVLFIAGIVAQVSFWLAQQAVLKK